MRISRRRAGGRQPIPKARSHLQPELPRANPPEAARSRACGPRQAKAVRPETRELAKAGQSSTARIARARHPVLTVTRSPPPWWGREPAWQFKDHSQDMKVRLGVRPLGEAGNRHGTPLLLQVTTVPVSSKSTISWRVSQRARSDNRLWVGRGFT